MGDDARSFWAWGLERKFPDEEARRGLAAQVSAVLGVGELSVRPLPSITDVGLTAPRFVPPPELANLGSSATVDRVTHTYGKSYRDLVRGFACDFSPAPDWVFYPADENEVAALLAFCSRERIAAIPYGGGTSVVGGVEGGAAGTMEAYAGVACIDLRKMDRVVEVCAESRGARIQAGALGPSIEAQLAHHGFSMRHFPQSFEFSTLGGWIATRAGGHFATLYTHVDDLVEAMRMVTPAGIFATRRLPASGAGPSPDRMAMGSEGILGVLTEAWVRVQPRPRFRASASVHFASFEDGVAASRGLAQSGLFPSNCRLLDAREALLHGVSDGARAVLLVAFESADHPLEPWMTRALAITASSRGTCTSGPTYAEGGEKMQAAGSDAASSWRQAFLDAPYLQSALVSLGVVVDTFETACTWDRFPALHRAVKSAVIETMKRVCGTGVITCRFTHVYPDGPAPYYTFIAPGRAGEELAQWEAIKRAASDALIDNGATITHHHAVGRLHRPWYDRERPDTFALALRAAKSALDPAWILNPGVLVDR